ncbi:MAG: hypothetical protein EU542_06890 [Promethearchaeota archaeon]|nr:MAG: hypothetical protein EU542_06890 [Candidatus Lokiarchaeota archaeon]
MQDKKQLIHVIKRLGKKKRGEVFLVCTVVMIIYMLSFISVIYELNQTQYDQQTDTAEFEEAYHNFYVETKQFMHSLLANYSQPGSIITDDITAGQILDQWLEFSEQQMTERGYFASFEINWITPGQPLEITEGDGFISIYCLIDVFLACNYLTIETQIETDLIYQLNYSNLVADALITFYYETIIERVYLGYSTVEVNGSPTESWLNGTYYHSSLLGAGDNIVATASNGIIVSSTV